jgi:hypothetical protein
MKRSELKRSTGEARASVKVTRCKACREPYVRLRPLQAACGVECARAIAEKKKAKDGAKAARAEASADKVKREDLKTLPQLLKEAQHAFNAFVRSRDLGKPCIDRCGAVMRDGAVGGGFDCGHYRSVGSAPHLRFDERNAHGQAKKCNQWLAGRAVDYRVGLIERLGLEAVLALEASNAAHKWTRDEVRAIRDQYRAKVRELKKEQE